MGDYRSLEIPNQYNELTPVEETDIYVPNQDYQRIFMNNQSNAFKDMQKTLGVLINQNRETINLIRDQIIQ